MGIELDYNIIIIQIKTYKLTRQYYMNISIIQAASRVGDLQHNFKVIKEKYDEALAAGDDICLFPELMTTGYLAKDLFFKESFINDLNEQLDLIIKHTKKTFLLLPTALMEGGKLYNAVIAAADGVIIGRTYKKSLPNFGIFDERRYFSSGNPQIIEINNVKIGVPICRDIWSPEVCKTLQKQDAKLFIVVNGSPFEKDKKLTTRIALVTERFNETSIPLIYCNQALAQDGIIFDGKSFIYDGKTQIICKAFAEDTARVIYAGNKLSCNANINSNTTFEADIYQAIMLATKDYVKQNGFNSVIIGLSGGIDSALVCVLAVDCFGAENVHAVMMPTKYTSSESIEDAWDLAKSLGIRLQEINIDHLVNLYHESLNLDTDSIDIAAQNLQSRIRGTILMTIANEQGKLLLSTGNKSESATGYATLYGDMCGAFSPIGDLYKTEIYKVVNYLNNKQEADIIPANIINKAPSAELKPNQKDSDDLGDYNVLDQILQLYIEQDLSKEEIINNHNFNEEIVSKIIRLVKKSEFKRQQAAPVARLTKKDFKNSRRYPITNGYP